jgi:hypothetical protein
MFRTDAPEPPAPPRAPRVSTGWLESPYGRRAAVSIIREIDRLVVVHQYVGEDRQPVQEPVYTGRSPREAAKAANQLLHTLRLRGYRSRHPACSDASFIVGEVCQALDVALG